MTKSKCIILFFIIIFSLFAQNDFESFLKSENKKQNSFQKSELKAQTDFYNQQDSLFIQYKDEIEKKWNEFVESTPKEWVSYNSDFSGRSQVNFEKNEVKVESVVEQGNTTEQNIVEEKKAKEVLKKQIISVLTEKDEITQEPLLKNQITLQNKVIEEKDIKKVAEKIINNSKKETFKNKEGKTMVRYKIKLTMLPNNLQIRVKKFKPTIERFCKKYNVDVSLALAIIHTESYFNPKAYNRHGNAYGMMQIVPKYAGRTMNNYLYKKNKKPSSRQLFNPETNLEMGIAYLRWLADNKWTKVNNKTNQTYCIICSYNGGPGTIYKAMTGKMTDIGNKWEPMFEELSYMDSNLLYQRLRKKVPWEETRKYIKLVTEKMDKYYKEI